MSWLPDGFVAPARLDLPHRSPPPSDPGGGRRPRLPGGDGFARTAVVDVRRRVGMAAGDDDVRAGPRRSRAPRGRDRAWPLVQLRDLRRGRTRAPRLRLHRPTRRRGSPSPRCRPTHLPRSSAGGSSTALRLGRGSLGSARRRSIPRMAADDRPRGSRHERLAESSADPARPASVTDVRRAALRRCREADPRGAGDRAHPRRSRRRRSRSAEFTLRPSTPSRQLMTTYRSPRTGS